MSIKSLRKGKKGEYEFRKLCESKDFTPINQAEDRNKPDIRLGKYDIEVKYRESVPSKIYDWLKEKNADILAVKKISPSDKGNDWLFVMREDLFFEFMKIWKK